MSPMRAMKEYYDRRAPEYDDWYLGTGLYADCQRPGWNEDLWELERVVADLPPARTLDVARGTGFLTRFLRGEVVGLDQSERMVEIASWRVPGGRFVVGDALDLPFESGSFERILTGHFYGHLDAGEGKQFLTEARGGRRDSRDRLGAARGVEVRSWLCSASSFIIPIGCAVRRGDLLPI